MNEMLRAKGKSSYCSFWRQGRPQEEITSGLSLERITRNCVCVRGVGRIFM